MTPRTHCLSVNQRSSTASAHHLKCRSTAATTTGGRATRSACSWPCCSFPMATSCAPSQISPSTRVERDFTGRAGLCCLRLKHLHPASPFAPQPHPPPGGAPAAPPPTCHRGRPAGRRAGSRARRCAASSSGAERKVRAGAGARGKRRLGAWEGGEWGLGERRDWARVSPRAQFLCGYGRG